MQHFQSILIVIGILAIAGVSIHGFLLNRKNKLALKAEEQAQIDELEEQMREDAEDDDSDDELTGSSVKRDFDSVSFSSHIEDEKDEIEKIEFNLDPQIRDDQTSDNQIDEHKINKQQSEPIVIKSIDEVISTSKVSVEPLLKNKTVNKLVINETAKVEKTSAENKKTENEAPVELFIFNVAAKNGERLGGHELLQFFLTSGFRYGDMNIFHRHEHSNGTGPILFSIANMMAPGTFDVDYMEQFNSPGISFFFTAPNHKISVNKSFDMMLRAVEQVAEEFDCEVLNEKREKFTHEQFIEYRKRLEKYK